jgi:hypothetical protein
MKDVNTISLTELTKMAENMYGNLVKAVVDIQKDKLVVNAEMHADIEQYLLEHDSEQNDLWGINIYPEKYGGEAFIEFDSMINIRPRQQNMSRGVDNPDIRTKIINLVLAKVTS